MSNRDLTLSMKLYADATRFVSGLLTGETGVRKFTSSAKREFEALKQTIGSVEGRLASLGLGVGITASVMQSAKLDKQLIQLGQTAGEDSKKVSQLRQELFRMAEETGQPVDDLKDSFNNAVQAGLNFKEALPVTDAVNQAMVITGASADRLTGSLTVASSAFSFDLAKPNMAVQLLEKMTVAGRKGNAELGSLSDIFARVGPSASAAGFGFDKTLAFIEGLSQIERQPERLATLADSTLRLFNNLKYMKDAQQATGVKFFDANGSRRDPLAVIADIKKQYDKLKTDRERAVYIQKAFGQADLDTIKGMRVLLNGEMLTTINKFATGIQNAGGTFKHDLPQALHNSVDQVGRLKAALRHAADDFAQPINDTLQNVIQWSMDKKENGGLGMDGKDMLLTAGGGLAATLLAARFGGKLLGGMANLGAGVATGKALQTAAGVTPVYVVNMPGSLGMPNVGLPGANLPTATTVAGTASKFKVGAALLGGSDLAAIRMMGAGAMSTAALMVAGVGAASYGFGSLINKGIEGTAIANAIGRQVAIALAPFSHDAREALKAEINNPNTFKSEINLKVNGSHVGTFRAPANSRATKFDVDTGPHMALAG